MNSNTKLDIRKAFCDAISSIDTQDDFNHEARMIMYRFLGEVERISDEKNMNRKELASKIGTSASYITQLFRGYKLINLPTIAKFQKALDFKFEIKAIPNNEEDKFKGMNINEIFDNNNIEGFWAFHPFKHEYEINQDNAIDPEKKGTKRTA